MLNNAMTKSGDFIIDRKELARRLKEARNENGLTQSQLARLVGVAGLTDSFISQVELSSCAFRKDYHIDWIGQVAQALDIEVPYINKNKETSSIELNAKSDFFCSDPELNCINECLQALKKLATLEARSRVIDYLDRRYCTDVDQTVDGSISKIYDYDQLTLQDEPEDD